MRTQRKVQKMRKALKKSNTRLLLSSVAVFQLLAMLLISLQGGAISTQALILAAAMPLATILVTNIMGKIWPVDKALLILIMLLCSVGIIALSDICKSEETPRTQAIYALAGLVAMFIGAGVIRSFSKFLKRRKILMALCLIALLTPLLPAPIGGWYQGARNWIHLGPLSAQPSEFMKPVIIIILAAIFANRPRFFKCIPGIAFAAVCCGILLVERDLGALLLYFLTTVLMYYAATSNAAVALTGLGMGAGAAVAAYHALPYVQDRVAIWRNPWSDPLDTGWQIVQSLMAIGSGGLFGMGMGLGSPRNVPLYHSDFIFTSIAEEFGLIFSIGLLAIYVIIIFRGLLVAMNARTSFHSLTAFGIVIIFGLQAFLIVGGNTKMLPLTGVTLPLISYGGSSLVSTFFSMGLLLGISSANAEDEARDITRIELREGGIL